MINRKVFVALYFSAVALLSTSLVYMLILTTREKKVKTDVGALLPDLTLYDLDQKPFKLAQSEQFTLMVFFNSTCENCIYEGRIIKENISLFGNAYIVMLSTEAIPSIQKFSEQTGLLGYHNIKFARVEFDDQHKFGQISFPFILVYGPDKRLLRKFHGMVDPQEIVHYLHGK